MSGFCGRCGEQVCVCDEKLERLEQENAELKRQHEQAIEQLKSYEQMFKDATKAVAENSELKRKLNAAIEVIGDHEDKATRLEQIIAESQAQPAVAECFEDGSIDGGIRWIPYSDLSLKIRVGSKFYTSPVIQEGMQLVPIEPTENMCEAWRSEVIFDKSYKAMLNASKE